MQSLRVTDNIVPVSEFKTKAAEWLRRLSETAEPLVITQNGRAAGVLISPEVFDRLTERDRFIHAVEQGLEDLEAGRASAHADVVAEMRARFGVDGDE